MATNDQVVLARVLKQRRGVLAPELTESDYFGFFVVEQLLRSYDLSWDEIENGITDGGNDGGIDAFYVFVNGSLITEDVEVGHIAKDAAIDVEILQAKKERSFTESAMDKLLASLPDLLHFDNDLDDMEETYNEPVRAAAANFRRVFLDLAGSFPRLTIRVRYASQGDQVHPNVVRKGEKVATAVEALFPDADVIIDFPGAARLLELAQSSPSATYPLRVVETVSSANAGFVCLVRLSHFNDLISLADGTLRTSIFEANVRDYQGKVEVNSAIREALESPTGEDFWWLNNGVTILAANGSLATKVLTLDSPQIVNGLQTSTELHKYFSAHPEASDDDRNVLVRVVITEDEASRDRIIRATNSQTTIPPASLRAMDPLQRRIETYFHTHDLYYDRRKNYYKNRGKPREKIISIPYLAQAVMSVALARPDDARARPSSLLKKDEDYERVFSDTYSVDMYLTCAALMRLADQYLLRKTDYSANRRNNLKFNLAYVVARLQAGDPELSPGQLDAVDVAAFSDDHLADALKFVEATFEALLTEDSELASEDQVAKSRTTVVALTDRLKTRFSE